MADWQRGDWLDSTSLEWVNPSPNMRNLNEALLYPGIAMLEAATNYSVGRGTDGPFEQIGADWIDGQQLAAVLNAKFIPGVRVYPTKFQPTSSHFAGKTISGVHFVVTNRETFNSVRLGLEVAAALQKLYPHKIDLQKCRFLIGNKQVIREIEAGADAQSIERKWRDALESYMNRRKAYLMY
jgi:uncharacterized protein YbbC (DUF1343 family)